MNKKLTNNLFRSAALALIAGLVIIPAAYCDPSAATLSASTEASLQASSEATSAASSEASYSASSEAGLESGWPLIFTGANNGSIDMTPAVAPVNNYHPIINAPAAVPEIQVKNYYWPTAKQTTQVAQHVHKGGILAHYATQHVVLEHNKVHQL